MKSRQHPRGSESEQAAFFRPLSSPRQHPVLQGMGPSPWPRGTGYPTTRWLKVGAKGVVLEPQSPSGPWPSTSLAETTQGAQYLRLFGVGRRLGVGWEKETR